MLSVALGELPSGLRLVSGRPLLHGRVMRSAGLFTYSLLDIAQDEKQGFNAITRKADVYRLAQRLWHLGDGLGANACYTELFGSGGVFAG